MQELHLGYLNEPHILDSDAVQLYYRLVKNYKLIKDKSLFHSYPFAVKMLVSKNKAETSYFLKQLAKLKLQHNKLSESLINALFLEANSVISTQKFEIINNDSLDDKSNTCHNENIIN